MLFKRNIITLFVLMTLLSVLSCSKSSSSDDDDEDEDPTTGGTVSTQIEDVSGKIFLEDIDHPLENYIVWIIDHTKVNLLTATTGSDGGFAFPTELFVDGHNYSIHVLTPDWREIGALDYSTDDEVQGVIRYEGGYGFKAGDIIVNENGLQQIDFDDPGLIGELGGSFTLDDTYTAGMSDVTLPSKITDLNFQPQLIIDDPFVLLNSFYLQSTNPSSYSRDLAKYSQITSKLTADLDVMDKVYLYEAGNWHNGSLFNRAYSQSLSSAKSWENSDFKWYKTSDADAETDSFSANVFTNKMLPTGSAIQMVVVPNSGDQYNIPLRIGAVFADPPKVNGISLAGAASSAIDYTTATENGLTAPFCFDSLDVTLGLLFPTDLSDTPWTIDDLDKISLQFSYYSRSGSSLSKIAVSSSDLPSGFDAAIEDSLSDSSAREWDPDNWTMEITPAADPASGSSFDIEIWNELFLAAAAGKTVDTIKINYYFYSSANFARSGGVVLFKRSCS